MFFGGFPGGDFPGMGGKGGGRNKNVDTTKFYKLLEVDKFGTQLAFFLESILINPLKSFKLFKEKRNPLNKVSFPWFLACQGVPASPRSRRHVGKEWVRGLV